MGRATSTIGNGTVSSVRTRLISRSQAGLFALLLLLGLLPASLHAQESEPPRLSLPVDCKMGVVCFTQTYFDHDPTEGVLDYTGGHLASEKHRGTDIRVPDIFVMQAGVPVVAAAPGVVRNVRDGMEDVSARTIDRDTIRKRKAGNAVAIKHGPGWETQYSHLLKGSVVVQPGDKVEAGQVLGMIGMSGWAEFPHLHFAVRYKGQHIDPFTGGAGDEQIVDGPLWTEDALAELDYIKAGVMSAGFADTKPTLIESRKGSYEDISIASDAPLLTFWANVFGQKEGDLLEMRVLDPDGKAIVKVKRPVKKDRILGFFFIGKKLTTETWPAGTYRGQFRLTRNQDGTSEEIASASRSIEIP